MDGHSSTNVHLRTSWHRIINFQATASNCRGMSKIGQVLDTMGNQNLAVGFQVKWNTIKYILFHIWFICIKLFLLKKYFLLEYFTFWLWNQSNWDCISTRNNELESLNNTKKKITKYSHDYKLIFKIISHVYEIRSDS